MFFEINNINILFKKKLSKNLIVLIKTYLLLSKYK